MLTVHWEKPVCRNRDFWFSGGVKIPGSLVELSDCDAGRQAEREGQTSWMFSKVHLSPVLTFRSRWCKRRHEVLQESCCSMELRVYWTISTFSSFNTVQIWSHLSAAVWTRWLWHPRFINVPEELSLETKPAALPFKPALTDHQWWTKANQLLFHFIWVLILVKSCGGGSAASGGGKE